jgi:DNA relaxase NicK
VPSDKNGKQFLKAMLAEMNSKMDATQEIMERQIGSLVSIMEAIRKTDRDEMKKEIKADQEHIKEILETQCGSLAAKLDDWKTDAGRPRSEQDHGFEGKS